MPNSKENRQIRNARYFLKLLRNRFPMMADLESKWIINVLTIFDNEKLVKTCQH